ncbi:MAG: class I tRNA ligase family protein, partial [Chloroflexota bacterium]|nr:class I tRNA ligase family protein [Chloroflexota bacterium]
MSEIILIGVAWPYANGSLHLGQVAGAYLPADIFARYHRLDGDEVLMVSGS